MLRELRSELGAQHAGAVAQIEAQSAFRTSGARVVASAQGAVALALGAVILNGRRRARKAGVESMLGHGDESSYEEDEEDAAASDVSARSLGAAWGAAMLRVFSGEGRAGANAARQVLGQTDYRLRRTAANENAAAFNDARVRAGEVIDAKKPGGAAGGTGKPGSTGTGGTSTGTGTDGTDGEESSGGGNAGTESDDAGVEYWTWNAVIDGATCKRCRSLDGQQERYIRDFETRPPVHVQCRCSIDCITFSGKSKKAAPGKLKPEKQQDTTKKDAARKVAAAKSRFEAEKKARRAEAKKRVAEAKVRVEAEKKERRRTVAEANARRADELRATNDASRKTGAAKVKADAEVTQAKADADVAEKAKAKADVEAAAKAKAETAVAKRLADEAAKREKEAALQWATAKRESEQRAAEARRRAEAEKLAEAVRRAERRDHKT